jgi:tetratricopeptide (TPR) repeat protein
MDWHPLAWVSHMVDVQFFGLNPAGHHAVNLLLHITNAILLFLVLRRITGAHGRSAFVAALFALHPLQVEPVAWISERKDVLGAFFWIVTMWAYSRYAQALPQSADETNPKAGMKVAVNSNYYRLALIFFIAGVMTTPVVLTLPFVLLLLDFWPLNRISKSAVLSPAENSQGTILGLLKEKIPFFVASGIFYAIILGAQAHAMDSSTGSPVSARLANAFVSYAEYLGKIFWPASLALPYVYPGSWPLLQVALSVLLVAVVSAAAAGCARELPWVAVGWFWFLVTLVPVFGHSMADHDTYIPLIGLCIAVVWGAAALAAWAQGSRESKVEGRDGGALTPPLSHTHSRTLARPPATLSHPMGEGRGEGFAGMAPRVREKAVIATAVLLLAVLGTATFNQVRYWRNSATLFGHALAVTENNYEAHDYLGFYDQNHDRYPAAVQHYQEALRIRPTDYVAYDNIGLCRFNQGLLDEAVTNYQKALTINPGDATALNNLGTVFNVRGQFEDAARCLKSAVRLKPDYAEARNNLGVALHRLGKIRDAAQQFTLALQLDPNDAETHNNFANLQAGSDRTASAIAHYRRALSINPNFTQALNNLGWTLATQKQFPEAIVCYNRALKIKPEDETLHRNFARVLAASGKYQEAIVEYKEALRLNPADQPAQRELERMTSLIPH